MAIKAGMILHDAKGFVIDRIQTGGVSALNIPQEKVHELGNFQTVATIRDIPDLTFDLESFDVSTEIEALLTNVDPTTVVNGQGFDFLNTKPLDIISPFKAGLGLFNIIRGIAVPYLSVETITYRFGNKQNATQQVQLRGDAVYYLQGSPYAQSFAGNGSTTNFTLNHTALPFVDGANTLHVLSACVIFSNGTFQRLFYGQDYTDSTTVFTVINPSVNAPAGSTLHVVYGSTVAATYPQSVHQDVSVKPAAVRGKDIDVYIGTTAATPVFTRWTGVQSFEAIRKVTLDNDQEFGNSHYVAQDYDIADVTGNIVVRPRDPTDLWDKIYQVANIPSNEVVGPFSSVTLPVELRINDPETGTRLKTIYSPDVRFTIPNVQGRVQQKLDVTFPWSSDSGTLLVYKGVRP